MLLNPYRFSVGGGGEDPNFTSVALLLHMDGTAGSTTFTDSSSTPKTCTGSGAAVIDAAIAKFAQSASFSGGASDSIIVANHANLNLSDGSDWTIEFFVRMSSVSANTLINKDQTVGTSFASYQVGVGGGSMKFFVTVGNGITTTGGFAQIMYGTTTPVANTWYHVATTKQGTSLRIFVNGILENVATVAANMMTDGAKALHIGAKPGVSGSLYANIDELRITKGVARYTANFTAPTSPFPDF